MVAHLQPLKVCKRRRTLHTTQNKNKSKKKSQLNNFREFVDRGQFFSFFCLKFLLFLIKNLTFYLTKRFVATFTQGQQKNVYKMSKTRRREQSLLLIPVVVRGNNKKRGKTECLECEI